MGSVSGGQVSGCYFYFYLSSEFQKQEARNKKRVRGEKREARASYFTLPTSHFLLLLLFIKQVITFIKFWFCGKMICANLCQQNEHYGKF